MSELNEKTEITEMNIDEMSRLAEDVMQQLYVNYIDYGNCAIDFLERVRNRPEEDPVL